MPPRLQRGVHLETLPAGTTLRRVHRSNRGCLWFGPAPGNEPECRWDAPGGEFRTLYAGLNMTAAFAESVLHRPAGQVISRGALLVRSWSEIRVNRDLQLAHFQGPGLLKHGLTAAEVSGDYDVTQALSLEVYEAHAGSDGILYRSTHNNDHSCVALFHRVSEADLTVVQTVTFSAWGQDNWLPLVREHGAIVGAETPVPSDTDAILLAEREHEAQDSRAAKSSGDT
jgi:hypothetical protein